MLLDPDKDIIKRFKPETPLSDELLLSLGWKSCERGEWKDWINESFMKGTLIELNKGYLYSYHSWCSHCDKLGDLMRIINNNPKLLL